MRHIVFTLLFILSFNLSSSQSVTSDLFSRQKDLFDTNFIKTNYISKIVEIDTSYVFNQLIATKSFYEYNTSGLILSNGIVTEEGSYKTDVLYEYDSKNRLILNYSPPNIEGFSDSTTFKYINRYCLKTVTYGPSNLVFYSTVFYDSLGYPTESITYLNDSSLIDHEIASYNYKKNRVMLESLTEPKHKATFVIDYDLEEKTNYQNKKYNSNGDLIEYIYNNTTYKIDYEYDNKGNWIYRSKYYVKNKINIPIEIKYREIFYDN